jgi:long-chain acyl-CoA synthetase
VELNMTQTTDLPASLPALVAQRATDSPGRVILRRKARGIWKSVTWAAMAEQVARIACGLRALDIGRGHTVAIIAETRPETVYADLAAQACGAASLVLPGYAEAPQLQDSLQASGSRALFVEDEEQLDKLLAIRGACPALSRVIIFDMKGLRDFTDPQCSSLTQFMQPADGFDWVQAARDASAAQPAAILPSGGVLSQGDIISLLTAARGRLGLKPSDERLALLSMAQPAERFWGLYAALDSGCISNYPEGPDTGMENLRELQPTVLGTDSAVWTHLHARTTQTAADATPVQRLVYNRALRSAWRGGAFAGLADALVLRAVRRKLGLSRLRLAYTDGEAVPAPALDWARGLGIGIQRIDAGQLHGAPQEPRRDPFLQQAHA